MDYSAHTRTGETYLKRIEEMLKDAMIRLAEGAEDDAVKEAAAKVVRGESSISDFLLRPDVTRLTDRGMTQFSQQIRSLSDDQRQELMKAAMAQAQKDGLADAKSELPVFRIR